jgi:hypothetical protein
MRKAIATLGISATLLGGGAALLPAAAKASPPPKDTTAQQKKACERAGGTFIDLDGLAKICLLPKA